MQWYIFIILVSVTSTLSAQQFAEIERDDGSYSVGVNSNSVGETADSVAALLTKASGWTGQSGRAGVQGDVNIQVPNFFSSGVQIAKQVPYVEILKLIESFLRLKGELSGRIWALIYDNAHIFAAIRDTAISKIATVHSLTLNAIIILRKVLEFASSLFSNVHVNVGSSGSLFNAGLNFG